VEVTCFSINSELWASIRETEARVVILDAVSFVLYDEVCGLPARYRGPGSTFCQ
jgi:hypothetical protein